MAIMQRTRFEGRDLPWLIHIHHPCFRLTCEIECRCADSELCDGLGPFPKKGKVSCQPAGGRAKNVFFRQLPRVSIFTVSTPARGTSLLEQLERNTAPDTSVTGLSSSCSSARKAKGSMKRNEGLSKVPSTVRRNASVNCRGGSIAPAHSKGSTDCKQSRSL